MLKCAASGCYAAAVCADVRLQGFFNDEFTKQKLDLKEGEEHNYTSMRLSCSSSMVI